MPTGDVVDVPPARPRARVPAGSQPGAARGRRRSRRARSCPACAASSSPDRTGGWHRARWRSLGIAARVAAARGTDVGAAAARVGARGRTVAARVDRVPRTAPAGGRAADRRHADDARDPDGSSRPPSGSSWSTSSTWTPTRSAVRRGACAADPDRLATQLIRSRASRRPTTGRPPGPTADERARRAMDDVLDATDEPDGAPTRARPGRGRARRRHAVRGELDADPRPGRRDGAARRAPGAREPRRQRHRRPGLDRARRRDAPAPAPRSR